MPKKAQSFRDSELTVHSKIAIAILPYRGDVLKTAEIKRIVADIYNDLNMTSLLPNDHAAGNKNPCRCAGTDRRIFDQKARGLYFVR